MMKWLLIAALLFGTGPREIAKINKLKKEAEEAFKRLDFETAAAKYVYLRDSLGVEDPDIALNLAHSYYQMVDTANAKQVYGELAMNAPAQQKSIALQQLGVMAKHPSSLDKSLQYLKSSLKADPTNEGARYDYEVVRKLIDAQKENQQDDNQQNQDQQQDQDKENEENKDQENQDQQNQDQQNQENGEQQEQEEQQQQEQQPQESEEEQEGEEQQEQQQQEGEESEEEQQQPQEQSAKEKLQEMNISEEKARMILEALRNNEIQYIQQQKRKAKKRPPSGKPDW